MKEENWECERTDFTSYGKMWRNGNLESKMDRLICKGMCYMRYPKRVQIDMEMPFKGGLSLILGSRSVCSCYFFPTNFQNCTYIAPAYVRCDIPYDLSD